ncbi:hypothetical protein HMPREF0262_02750 [Clostridium sp. ATCC 29733]|nr:hypothetical protein HMPREF0262_02750 [Clostridium sp. ATCC 29733]
MRLVLCYIPAEKRRRCKANARTPPAQPLFSPVRHSHSAHPWR